jgi:hypothetical protein
MVDLRVAHESWLTSPDPEHVAITDLHAPGPSLILFSVEKLREVVHQMIEVKIGQRVVHCRDPNSSLLQMSAMAIALSIFLASACSRSQRSMASPHSRARVAREEYKHRLVRSCGDVTFESARFFFGSHYLVSSWSANAISLARYALFRTSFGSTRLATCAMARACARHQGAHDAPIARPLSFTVRYTSAAKSAGTRAQHSPHMSQRGGQARLQPSA